MRSVFSSVLGYFLTPAGVVLMGALDASLVFFLPLGIDVVVIVMAARRPHLFWLYGLLAASGSVAGAALTYWIGRKVGEHGLARLVSATRLERVKARVSGGAAVSLAALGLVPPPFPFTPFVLTSGALNVSPLAFFATLAGVRLLRFEIETTLARVYGSQIIRWMRTPIFEGAVAVFIGLAVIGTIVSAVALVRGSRKTARAAA